jgi:chondroitin AC lyase
MMKKYAILFCFFLALSVSGQEILFADYFDIKTNENAGKGVSGKINLKRNKDVSLSAIPKGYHFVIEKSDSNVFEIETEFDSRGRVFGVLKVAKGKNTGPVSKDHNLTIALKDNDNVLVTKEITVHIVPKTMWEYLVEQYTPVTISNSRLYGRTKYSDEKLVTVLEDLEANEGQFSFTDMYRKNPSSYKNAAELDADWQNVSKNIGALGYSYAESKTFGIKSGNKENSQRLKRAIYKSVIKFTNSIPIDGKDLVVQGKAVGDEMGDGFSKNPFLSHGFLTHQWEATDALGAPLVHVWPEVLRDIEKGDVEAQKVYDSVIRYYQLFFSEVPGRRTMDNYNERWKAISDVNYSEGAWADANIGHRMRTLMVMPILWADYNRPITDVPYWYDDYYKGTKFEGLTFAKNWSPSGVINDVRSWCDKLSLPSHVYNQSGFHPDGTVTHHCGHHASDVALFAYGFEWLNTVNSAISYFKNTPYPIKDKSYQFIADRLNFSYRRMIYKNSFDFVVAGRSFYGDLSDFGSKQIGKTISDLLDGKAPTTKIENESELKQLKSALKKGNHIHSETISFWNADYLVHRKETKEANYYFSVKHKSVRTSGAEDFDKIRKSWHAASGVFLLRVDGDEYASNVMTKADWHVLPGVTEAWRTDPMPKGPASASLPGGNAFSGMLADGNYGLAGYHHQPIDSYTGAEALKSTHMIGRFGTALGTSVKRKTNSSSSDPIVSCIDQSELRATLSYSINGQLSEIKPGESVNVELELKGPTWIHHKNKGYLIYPQKGQKLYIKTASNINVTDTRLKDNLSKNYIIALGHGINPEVNKQDAYHYVQVANASVNEMSNLLESYVKNSETVLLKDSCHGISNADEKVKQAVFYKAGTLQFTNYSITTDKPSLVMVKDLGTQIRLSFSDPLHSLENSKVVLHISEKLKEGKYSYNFPGIYPRKGETAEVTSAGLNLSKIVISLPDTSDGLLYDYKEQLYAGAPIVLTLDKN